MPLSFALTPTPELLAMLTLSSFTESGDTVGVEGVREKVLARGPRCVSLSSTQEALATSTI
jgi:hypothetical protein